MLMGGCWMEAGSSLAVLGTIAATSGVGRRKRQRSYTEKEVKRALPSHRCLMMDKVVTGARGVGCRNWGTCRRWWAARSETRSGSDKFGRRGQLRALAHAVTGFGRRAVCPGGHRPVYMELGRTVQWAGPDKSLPIFKVFSN
jgi:hypothetical protein